MSRVLGIRLISMMQRVRFLASYPRPLPGEVSHILRRVGYICEQVHASIAWVSHFLRQVGCISEQVHAISWLNAGARDAR